MWTLRLISMKYFVVLFANNKPYQNKKNKNTNLFYLNIFFSDANCFVSWLALVWFLLTFFLANGNKLIRSKVRSKCVYARKHTYVFQRKTFEYYTANGICQKVRRKLELFLCTVCFVSNKALCIFIYIYLCKLISGATYRKPIER